MGCVLPWSLSKEYLVKLNNYCADNKYLGKTHEGILGGIR